VGVVSSVLSDGSVRPTIAKGVGEGGDFHR